VNCTLASSEDEEVTVGRRVMAVLILVVLTTAACGGDDGRSLGDAEKAIAEVVAVELMADPDPDNPFGDEESARCFARGLVADLGITRLAEIGITADGEEAVEALGLLNDAEIDAMVDLALECIDFEEVLAAEFAAGGIGEDSARCLVGELAETDFLRLAFRAGMIGDESFDPSDDPAFLAEMIGAAARCLTPDEMRMIMGG
jgi:hypothetical protein